MQRRQHTSRSRVKASGQAVAVHRIDNTLDDAIKSGQTGAGDLFHGHGELVCGSGTKIGACGQSEESENENEW
jgi:hypothetical protein